MNSNIEQTNKLKVYRFPSQEKYHCSKCRHEIPFKNRKDIDFNYCPYCGKNLFEVDEESEERYITAEEYMKTGKWIGE